MTLHDKTPCQLRSSVEIPAQQQLDYLPQGSEATFDIVINIVNVLINRAILTRMDEHNELRHWTSRLYNSTERRRQKTPTWLGPRKGYMTTQP